MDSIGRSLILNLNIPKQTAEIHWTRERLL